MRTQIISMEPSLLQVLGDSSANRSYHNSKFYYCKFHSAFLIELDPNGL